MKKLLSLFLIILCITMASCGNNTKSSETSTPLTTSNNNKNSASNKAVEDGKIALAGKNFEKAKNDFKLAETESESNSQAKELYKLTDDYINLLKCMKNKYYAKAQQYLNSINKNSEAPVLEDNLKIITEQLAQIKYTNDK